MQAEQSPLSRLLDGCWALVWVTICSIFGRCNAIVRHAVVVVPYGCGAGTRAANSRPYINSKKLRAVVCTLRTVKYSHTMIAVSKIYPSAKQTHPSFTLNS